MKKDKNQLKYMIQGIYTLVIFLSEEITVEIGKLGNHRFLKGYYTYTGSALGKGSTNLKNRVKRHSQKNKRKFWHIDYLLANEKSSIEVIIAAQTSEKKECILNNFLQSLKGIIVQVNGFGSSDCKNRCSAHLLFFPGLTKKECLVNKILAYLGSEMKIQNVDVIYN